MSESTTSHPLDTPPVAILGSAGPSSAPAGEAIPQSRRGVLAAADLTDTLVQLFTAQQASMTRHQEALLSAVKSIGHRPFLGQVSSSEDEGEETLPIMHQTTTADGPPVASGNTISAQLTELISETTDAHQNDGVLDDLKQFFAPEENCGP